MFKWALTILILGINTLCFPEQLHKTPILHEQIFINIFANHQQFTPEVVRAAFQALNSFSSNIEAYHTHYYEDDEMNITIEAKAELSELGFNLAQEHNLDGQN